LLQELSTKHFGRVHAYSLDVRDSVAVQKAAQRFISDVGVPDIVIANAGVSRGTLTDHVEDEEVFQKIMDINVLGMVKTFQPFLSPMREAKRGTLVGIASVAGFRGLPGSGAYSASKAAAISYLESLRVELRGSGIKVVTLCPGYIKTPMTDVNQHPMPFIIEADDAAQRMARVIHNGKTFAVVPWQMGMVGSVLKLLPNRLYDWALGNAPRKPRNPA
jgi:short-subunit dehydrogenase